MKTIYLTLISLVLLTNSFAQSAAQTEADIKAIENGLIKNILIKGDSVKKMNIEARMAHYKVPGLSIAIVQNGKIQWAKGYGFANTETKTKIDVNTLFQAGSISKPLAALSALKLAQEGQLDLNKNVNHYLKNWQIEENKFTTTEKVTIKRLLTHTAGTTVHGFPGYQQTDSFPKIIDVLDGKGNTAKIEVDTIPGSIWRYSGGGYTVMEKAVEDVSGLPLEDYMANHILSPIGMKNSTYSQPVANEWQGNISAAYDSNGQLIKGLWNNYPEQAAAGLWTTPSDLALYCLEVQDIMSGKKEGVLSKATIEKTLTMHKNDWGLGPSLNGEGQRLLFGHGGKNAGFTNDMVAFANQGKALIVMTNADNGGKLIAEIKNAVSSHYQWDFTKPRMIDVIELPENVLRRFTGKYELKDQGLILEVQFKEGRLYLENTPVGNLNLRPMSETKFIDIDSATVIEFLGDQEVTGFIANNTFKFDKIN